MLLKRTKIIFQKDKEKNISAGTGTWLIFFPFPHILSSCNFRYISPYIFLYYYPSEIACFSVSRSFFDIPFAVCSSILNSVCLLRIIENPFAFYGSNLKELTRSTCLYRFVHKLLTAENNFASQFCVSVFFFIILLDMLYY